MPRPTNAELQERQALLSIGRKVCRSCMAELPISSFGAHAKTRDGFQTACKPCTNVRMRTYVDKRTPEENRARKNIAQRARRAAAGKPDYDENRRSNLVKYRITPADFDNMMVAQGGVCAICGGLEMTERCGLALPLHVDHDHATGAVRMLLCTHCNRGLGCFRDDPALLATAAAYLALHRIGVSSPHAA